MVNNNRFGDVHVAEPNILAPLETDEEIDSGIGVEGCERPDGMREAGVVFHLALFVGAVVGIGGGEGGVRFAKVVDVVVDEAVVEAVAVGVFAKHAGVAAAVVRDGGEVAVSEEGFLGEGFALGAARGFGERGGDAGAGGAEEVGIGGFEEGRWQRAEETLGVRDGGDRQGFLVNAYRG